MDNVTIKQALERLDRAIQQKYDEIAALEAQRPALMQQYSEALAGNADQGRTLT